MSDPNPDDFPTAACPDRTIRLIPSRFPPINAFETVTDAKDFSAILELEGWTNDRLVAGRLARLPRDEWVFGRPNASVVMASFLHAAPDGQRFNGPDLGAWYAALALKTVIAEVAHHLRRDAVRRGHGTREETYRCYHATLDGAFVDTRGRAAQAPALFDPASHAAGQPFGEAVRAGPRDGILYDGVRHSGGTCVVAYRPTKVLDVVQGDHYRINVPREGKVVARRLAAD
jgi:hypothetical protein